MVPSLVDLKGSAFDLFSINARKRMIYLDDTFLTLLAH